MRKLFPNEQPVTVERRSDGTATISGYAAVYHREDNPGTQYELMPNYYERIQPGAFTRALNEGDDVRALFNHDASAVLGRSKSGTLRLSADKVGLKYEVDLPNTQLARDLAESVDRGDISGSSFAFSVTPEGQKIERDKNGTTYRNILETRLYDVSVVTYPAYEAATSGLRSSENVEEAKAALDSWESNRNAALNDVKVRLAKIKLDRDQLEL
jgi:HK97 family phage prohead protease